MQCQFSQVFRNVFRKLILSYFQPLGQLYHDFIDLFHRQSACDTQQSSSCLMTHRYSLAHLDQVRKMGCQMEDLALHSLLHYIIQKKINVDCLNDPRCSHFEVFTEDPRYRILFQIIIIGDMIDPLLTGLRSGLISYIVKQLTSEVSHTDVTGHFLRILQNFPYGS